MLIFLKKIWEFIRKFFKWLFRKKPVVRITILFLLLTTGLYAQRTDLQYLYAYFDQPGVEDVDLWSVVWYGNFEDSVYVYKSDTLRAKICRDSTWITFTYLEIDTAHVRLLLERPFPYDRELYFFLIARDSLGNASPEDSINVYFIASDINRITDPNMDCGYIDSDHRVDGLDLMELSRNWGQTGLGYRDFADINGDGVVDGLDLIQMARDWGRSWQP